MSFSGGLAVYFLFFCFTAFLLLPFGVRTSQEVGEELVPGQADSAPARFDLPRHLIRSALVALGLFALHYANWVNHWLTLEMFDFRWAF